MNRPTAIVSTLTVVAAALLALALQGMVDYTLRSAVIVALIFALSGAAVVLGRAVDQQPDQERARAR